MTIIKCKPEITPIFRVVRSNDLLHLRCPSSMRLPPSTSKSLEMEGPQEDSNFGLQNLNSLRVPGAGGATAQPGGATAQRSGAGRCNRPAKEVSPPSSRVLGGATAWLSNFTAFRRTSSDGLSASSRTCDDFNEFPISSRLVPAASPTILRTLKRPSNLTPVSLLCVFWSLPEVHRSITEGSSDDRRKFAGSSREEAIDASEQVAAVEPPKPGGDTAWAQSPSETGRCNRPSQEVAPLGLGLRALAEQCNRLSQAVAPPELGLRALARGATAPDKSWHRLEAKSSSSARRCNR
uniref:Uncharacterized protein n=1 Tax=Musa acuminata TaxID=4641 RepID=Q1EPB9_MUSAC|nr:hypothetical protein MA4_78I12.72 [Musa acuminata]